MLVQLMEVKPFGQESLDIIRINLKGKISLNFHESK